MYRGNDFFENSDGVHLSDALGDDRTLCGDSLDIAETEAEFTAGTLEETRKRIVTCEKCIRVIEHCRGVRFKRPMS